VNHVLRDSDNRVPLIRKARTLVGVGMACVGLALAACGSSGGSTTSGAAGSTAGGGTSSSATAISIGAICDCSGADATTNGPAEDGLQAWVGKTNASGGLNGRRIHLTVLDDKSDETQALSDARQLISQQVSALILNTGSSQVVQRLVDASKIPAIGSVLSGTQFGSDPYYFAADGVSLGSEFRTWLGPATQLGDNTVGYYYCAELSACSLAAQALQQVVPAAHLKWGGSWSVSATASGYQAQCLAAKNADVDLLTFSGPPNEPLRFMSDCQGLGYKPNFVSGSAFVQPSWLSTPQMDGTIVVFNTEPYFDTSASGVGAFQAAVKQYEPGATVGEETLLGWTAGVLLGAGVTASGASAGDSMTPQAVLDGLHALKGETLGGLTAPLTFPADGKYGTTCYFTATIRSGKWAKVSASPICPSQQ
jgi:branched-chain amino acid transport system substrate-binding protein